MGMGLMVIDPGMIHPCNREFQDTSQRRHRSDKKRHNDCVHVSSGFYNSKVYSERCAIICALDQLELQRVDDDTIVYGIFDSWANDSGANALRAM